MNFKKSVNSFKRKNNKLPDYLFQINFDYQFVNNFSELCKINILDIIDMVDFFRFWL